MINFEAIIFIDFEKHMKNINPSLRLLYILIYSSEKDAFKHYNKFYFLIKLFT